MAITTDHDGTETVERQGPPARFVVSALVGMAASGLGVVLFAAWILVAIEADPVLETLPVRLTVDGNEILSVAADPDDPIASIEEVPDELLLSIRDDAGREGRPFLTTLDRRTGILYHHFACQPRFEGRTSLVLEFESGERLRVLFSIEAPKHSPGDGGASRDDLMAEVQRALRLSEEFWRARENSDENLRDSYLQAGEALALLGRIDLGSLTDEFRLARQRQERAGRELLDRYVEARGDFLLAEKRKDASGARQALARMLGLRTGDGDLEYLKARVLFEYRYGGGREGS